MTAPTPRLRGGRHFSEAPPSDRAFPASGAGQVLGRRRRRGWMFPAGPGEAPGPPRRRARQRADPPRSRARARVPVSERVWVCVRVCVSGFPDPTRPSSSPLGGWLVGRHSGLAGGEGGRLWASPLRRSTGGALQSPPSMHWNPFSGRGTGGLGCRTPVWVTTPRSGLPTRTRAAGPPGGSEPKAFRVARSKHPVSPPPRSL